MTLTTNLFEFALLSFGSLFTMINPVGLLPAYISLTGEVTAKASRQIALRAALTALITLILFAVTGKLIFEFIGLDINSLRIVGGIIFFGAGYEMFNNKLPRMRRDGIDLSHAYNNAITPIGIPLICGPGAITTVMLLMQEGQTIGSKMVLFSAIFVVVSVTLVVMLSAQSIIKFLGETGQKVMMKLAGLFVMVVAVDFFIGGLKPVIKDLLC